MKDTIADLKDMAHKNNIPDHEVVALVSEIDDTSVRTSTT